MPHITQMRAKYSRKLQRPGYETNYEPQYAEFELVSTFGDEEQADDSDLHDLMDQAAHVVNTKLGLDSEDRGGQFETSRDVVEEKPAENPPKAASRRGFASNAAAPSEPTTSQASAAASVSNGASRRGGSAKANPTPASAADASPAESGTQPSVSAARRGGSSAKTTEATTTQSSGGEASAVKDTDLSKAASQLAAAQGTEVVLKMLSMYGVPNVNALKGADRQKFLDDVKDMLAE